MVSVEGEGTMSNLGDPVCPFYLHEKRSDVLNCELAKFRFPDDESKAQIKAYCCNMDKCKECPLYQVLVSYYDREYMKVSAGE